MKKTYINGVGCISAQKTFDTVFLEEAERRRGDKSTREEDADRNNERKEREFDSFGFISLSCLFMLLNLKEIKKEFSRIDR